MKNDILNELESHDFYCVSGMFPYQFHEIKDDIELKPNKILKKKYRMHVKINLFYSGLKHGANMACRRH